MKLYLFKTFKQTEAENRDSKPFPNVIVVSSCHRSHSLYLINMKSDKNNFFFKKSKFHCKRERIHTSSKALLGQIRRKQAQMQGQENQPHKPKTAKHQDKRRKKIPINWKGYKPKEKIQCLSLMLKLSVTSSHPLNYFHLGSFVSCFLWILSLTLKVVKIEEAKVNIKTMTKKKISPSMWNEWRGNRTWILRGHVLIKSNLHLRDFWFLFLHSTLRGHVLQDFIL